MGFVTQFPLHTATLEGSEIILALQGRNTACLAPDLCCPTLPTQENLVGLGRKK
jgi:hypothetical protein